MDMATLYVYYTISSNNCSDSRTNIYAYTENKVYDKRFQMERCMENFIRKKIHSSSMDRDEYSKFKYDYKEHQMIEIPLTDAKGNDISMIGTMREEINLNESHDSIMEDIDLLTSEIEQYVRDDIMDVSFSEEVLRILEYTEDTNGSYFKSAIDTYHLFCYLHHRTIQPPDVWMATENEIDAEAFSIPYNRK